MLVSSFLLPLLSLVIRDAHAFKLNLCPRQLAMARQSVNLRRFASLSLSLSLSLPLRLLFSFSGVCFAGPDRFADFAQLLFLCLLESVEILDLKQVMTRVIL